VIFLKLEKQNQSKKQNRAFFFYPKKLPENVLKAIYMGEWHSTLEAVSKNSHFSYGTFYYMQVGDF
jgi:hypothetical protein